MNNEILFKQIFQQEFTQIEADKFLDELQTAYPWFALPHFYKLKKTGIGKKNYNKLSALTAQFFPNIYLLNQRLNETHSYKSELGAIKPEKQEHEIDEVPTVVEPVTTTLTITQQSENANHINSLNTVAVLPEHQEHENEEPPSVEEPVTVNNLDYQETAVKEKTTTELNLEKAAADFKKNIVDDSSAEKEVPLFEPLHATDYFASQGIKLSEELKSQDKLGKQMKSFTDWLKVMKKTPEQQQGLQHVADELQIQNLANKSNTEADVITESMADVYLQQGKKEKAREIYKKLSLINPDKSAYFAAKIDNLNK